MIRRRRSLGFSFATVVVLGACAAALGVVSGGRAGSVSNNNFDLVVQPHVLSTLGTGFAKGTFTAASGPGTGSATHVVITITLPTGLEPTSGTSSDCTDPPGGDHTFTCSIGTVNAGQIVNRFVAFTAPATVAGPPFDTYTVTGSLTFDHGLKGAGGGGGIDTIPDSDSTDVYASTDGNHSGNCLSGGGSITTPPVNAADTQSTFMSFGAAAFFLPCVWAELGEGPAPASFRIPQISFVAAPVLANLATLTISIYQLPLSKIGTLKEFPNYPTSLTPALDVLQCPTPTSLPSNPTDTQSSDACELARSKSGNVTLLTLLFTGTGGDPGFGGG